MITRWDCEPSYWALALTVVSGVGGDSGPVRQRASEGLVGRQTQLLDHLLQEILPTSPDRSNLCFVGFAGFGREAVFKREVRQLFDERFETKGRSIALINHPTTSGVIPLATVTNLERALQHLGGLMVARRDTLFLLLTSHGDRGKVAVEMPALRADASFRRAFDRAKRWIAIWEVRDGIGRSLPQIAGGEALTDHQLMAVGAPEAGEA